MSILQILGLSGSNSASRISRTLLITGGIAAAAAAGGIALVCYWKKISSSTGSGSSQGLMKPKKAAEAETNPTGPTTALGHLSEADAFTLSKKCKEKGNELFKSGNFNKALTAFSEAIAKCPSNQTQHLAVCYQNRAATYEKLGELEKLIDDCTEALRLDKHYLKAVARRGNARRQLQQYEEALDDYTYASSIDRNETCDLSVQIDDVLTRLTDSLQEDLKANRKPILIRDESVLLWRNCYLNDPIVNDLKNVASFNISNGDSSGGSNANLYAKALNAIEKRRYEEVLPLLEEESKHLEDPNEILRNYIFRARCALMKEDDTSVKKYLEKFDATWRTLSEDEQNETKNKQFRIIYYLLGASIKSEGITDSTFDAAIKLDERNVDIYMAASLLFFQTLDFTSALKYLEKVSQIDSHHPLVKQLKANCRLAIAVEQGSVSETFRCMHEAHQLLINNENANPILYLLTGRLFNAAQNKELAVEAFMKASLVLPEYSAPKYNLAMLETEGFLQGSEAQIAILEMKMKQCYEYEPANPDALAILSKIAFHRRLYDEALELYTKYLAQCPLRYNIVAARPAVLNFIQLRSLCRTFKILLPREHVSSE